MDSIEVNLDITLQNSTHGGMECVKLVKTYLSEYDVLEPILLFLKHFLRLGELNNPYTGGLSSYALLLMIVAFLQQKQQLN